MQFDTCSASSGVYGHGSLSAHTVVQHFQVKLPGIPNLTKAKCRRAEPKDHNGHEGQGVSSS